MRVCGEAGTGNTVGNVGWAQIVEPMAFHDEDFSLHSGGF